MIKKKILIATGGTGGHIFPSLGVANNLIKNNYDVVFTADERGLKYLSDNKEINFIKIPSSPLIKKNIFTLSKSFLVIIFSILKSLILLYSKKPNIVLGMGGYSSFPICAAAAILRIKFIIYENNLIIGKANRYLLKYAEKIFVSYKDLEGISKKNKEKIITVGNIIREEILNYNFIEDQKKNFNKIRILVLGGSQGAKIFAETLPQVFKKLKDSGVPIKIFQQCHLNQQEKLSNFYKEENIKFEIFNFTNKISEYYSRSNLVITRSGASALGELINVNVPFIAIPLPTSADNHQYKNAKFYEKNGLCFFLEENYIADNLFDLIYSNYKDNTRIHRIISNQSQYSDKDVFNELNINIDKIINEKN